MKIIFFLAYIFCFASNFYIGAGLRAIPLYFFWTGLFLFLCAAFYPKISYRKLLANYKTRSFKWLLLFAVWSLVTVAISLYTGHFYYSSFLNAIFGGLICTIFFVFLTIIIALPELINFKAFIKVTFIIFAVIFVLGLIQYACMAMGINFIKQGFYFISNRRLIMGGGYTDDTRIMTLFLEPSVYAYFIIIISPFVYGLCFSKNKIFSNTLYDRIIKYTVFCLMLINLLLAQSPPYIVIGVLLLLIILGHWFRRLKMLPGVFIVNILILVMIIASFVVSLDIFHQEKKALIKMHSPIERVIRVIENIDEPEKLYIVEGSLITRYVIFYNSVYIFLKNPLFGVGYGNFTKAITDQLRESPIDIGWELEQYIKYTDETEEFTGPTSGIFFRTLAETGLIGIILLFGFFISLLLKIQKLEKFYKDIEKDFFVAGKYYIIIFLCTSFYTSVLHWVFIWIFAAILQAMVVFKLSETKNKPVEASL